MANPAPTINQINAFNATQGTTIDFNIIGGTELVRSNRIYIYDLSDNSLICTHLYVSTESIHELPPNTDGSIVYESGKSSADFVNGAQYYAQIQTFTDIAGTQGGSGLSVSKMFWCLDDPTLTIDTIPSTISTTSYNVSATYNANTSVVSNIIQQYQFSLYSATGSLLQSSGVIVGNGEQQGTSTAYDISYNFSGLGVGNSYYVVVDVTTTQGMSISTQSSTFTVSIDTPTLGEATVVNNACDGYISVTSNLSSEYGGSGSGDIVSFETDSENVFTKLQVDLEPVQDGTPWQGTDVNSEPYQFRAMPQQSNDYNREYDTIVGGTVAWNQLLSNTNFNGVSLPNNATRVYDQAKDEISYSATIGSEGYGYVLKNINTYSNRVYLIGAYFDCTNCTYVWAKANATATTPQSHNYSKGYHAFIQKANYGDYDAALLGVSAPNGTAVTAKISKANIIDLTAMFGTTIADYVYSLEQATAGAGVAWLKARGFFTKPYYEYDTGTIKSVNPTAHVTRGVNAWDEEWELGTLDNSGNNYASTTRIRAKNYIPVLGSATYYLKSSLSTQLFFYDADKVFISAVFKSDATFSTPSNACYMRFAFNNSYGTTYNHDICINISDPTINGKYYPYKEHTYPLGSDLELRGIPKLDASNNLYYDGDTYKSDGTVTRKYGVVTFDSSSWTLYDQNTTNIRFAIAKTIPLGKANSANVIFSGGGTWSVGDTAAGTDTNKLDIRASTIVVSIAKSIFTGSTGTEFGNYMNGKGFVYEKETTTTETANTYTNPQVCDPDGTEEYVTTSIVPVGHQSRYALVCPITGHDEVEASVVGKNIFDESVLLQASGWIENDGVYSGQSSALYNKFFNNPIPLNCVENEVYTFSCKFKSTNGIPTFFRFHYSDGTRSATQSESTSETRVTFVSTQGKTLTGLSFSYSATDVIYLSECQIELGITATDYVSYVDPQTISQDFDVSLTPTSTDTDPYLFKAVGNIYGDRLEEELVGGTVCWNQLVQNGDFSNGTANWVKYSASNPTTSWSANDGVLTHTITGGTTTHAYYYSIYQNGVIRDATHKHLVVIVVEPSVATTFRIEMGGGTKYTTPYTLEANKKTTVSCIVDAFTANKQLLFEPYSAVNQVSAPSMTMKYYSANVIDLTAKFGSATVADAIYNMEQAQTGSGIALLRASGFFNEYIPYDTGTLKSVEATAHVTTGKNQGNTVKYKGQYEGQGVWNGNLLTRITTEYIGVIPNTDYFIQLNPSNTDNIALINYNYFDADKNWLGNRATNGDSAFAGASEKAINISDKNARYIRITFMPKNDTDNIQSADLAKAEFQFAFGTARTPYEPYEEHTYDLGNVPLYGLFQLENGKLKAYGDVRHAEGVTDRKFAVLDMGTLNWEKNGNIPQYFATMPIKAVERSTNAIVSNGYTISASGAYDGNIDKSLTFMGTTTSRIWVRDSNYSTATELKTAMNGVYLVYPLATPTTETTPSFTQVQEVSKYGTLEYITSNDVPVGHNTTYMTRDVFGGTLDLVSGRLVVTHIAKDIGSLYLENYKTGGFRTVGSLDPLPISATGAIDDPILIVSMYRTYPASAILQSGQACIAGNKLFFVNADYPTDVNAFKQAMNGQLAVYKLATPLTYQLTPQQIQTLVGTNNVWSEQGDIELSYHIPITNLLVKRQDVDDVSGNWLTLYSQPITQASDMDFTFIDFLNQYGKTYKYALVPLLTQTQSGVEVEVEGGYTVSDEVQSVFDGVFISDSTGSQKCKANVGYGNVNMNQSVGSITPIGSQYPIIVTNSNNRYHNGSISGMIVPDDYYYNGNLSRIDMVNKRNELEQFLTNKRAKIIKDWNGNIWLVMIMDNIDCSFDNNYGMGIVTFNANWLEVGDPTNQEDLQATGLIDVGGV